MFLSNLKYLDLELHVNHMPADDPDEEGFTERLLEVLKELDVAPEVGLMLVAGRRLGATGVVQNLVFGKTRPGMRVWRTLSW